jgi:hypothetical protein
VINSTILNSILEHVNLTNAVIDPTTIIRVSGTNFTINNSNTVIDVKINHSSLINASSVNNSNISYCKLGTISKNGIASNITILNADVTNSGFLGQDRFESYFDKIFIDAPCSALGTISKNPDVKYACTLSDMERLGEITGKILSAADNYLKPGGIIVLYKCTLSEIENQEPVKRFIRDNPGKYCLCEQFFEIMPAWFLSEAGFICILKKSV